MIDQLIIGILLGIAVSFLAVLIIWLTGMVFLKRLIEREQDDEDSV